MVAASFFISPGRKNDAGETLVPALMPEQPTHINANTVANIANNGKLQFNFTLHSIKHVNTMATFNSTTNHTAKWKFITIISVFAAGIIFAADDANSKIFADRAEKEFQRAQKQLQSGGNSTNAVQFAHACYDFADFATSDNQRASLANQG
ncbi:MAG TPA: hypothetical protein VN516_02935, partial [Candidatus Baltobacteraceae bacterium]|nr:hypothetical protein [Candidatus Baltobacteraceae bacterium]